jgi:hypothetical protein
MVWHLDASIRYFFAMNLKICPLLLVVITVKYELAHSKPLCERHEEDYKFILKNCSITAASDPGFPFCWLSRSKLFQLQLRIDTLNRQALAN